MSGSLNKLVNFVSYNRLLLAILLVGIVVLAALDTLIVQRLHQDQQYRQTLVAQQIRARLQSSLNEHVTALISLNVVYQNFVEISNYDFQQYGEAITSNLTGFQRLFFVDQGVTIRRVYPLNPNNSQLLNIKLASMPVFKELFTKATKIKQPVTSPITGFMGDSQIILAVIPIYRNNVQLLGYATGEISLLDVWKALDHEDFEANYRIQIQDEKKNLLFPQVKFQRNDHLISEIPFTVADKNWTLMVESTASGFQTMVSQRIAIWTGGLVVIALLMLLLSRSRKHRENLANAQKEFETIFHASPDGIVLLDDKLNLRLSNSPVQTWTGLPPEKLAEKTFFDLFTCQCPHLSKCRELSFLLCTSEQFQGELPETLEAVTSDVGGENTRTVRLNASKLNRTGADAGFIAVLGDITTRKELERGKETYVATLTHDLRTPLLAQELVLQTMLSEQTGAVSSEQKKLLVGAIASVQDLLEMVNSTLLFYKLESSHLLLQKQRMQLIPVIREIVDALRPLVEKRELTLELEAPVDPIEISLDAVQIKRVFQNILSNAVSYARRETVITVKIEALSNDQVIISIANEGKGIAADELPKIFDKYYSLSRKFKQIGTGLGLYISRRIIELHGGRIWAESEPEKRTVFLISLPLPEQI